MSELSVAWNESQRADMYRAINYGMANPDVMGTALMKEGSGKGMSIEMVADRIAYEVTLQEEPFSELAYRDGVANGHRILRDPHYNPALSRENPKQLGRLSGLFDAVDQYCDEKGEK